MHVTAGIADNGLETVEGASLLVGYPIELSVTDGRKRRQPPDRA